MQGGPKSFMKTSVLAVGPTKLQRRTGFSGPVINSAGFAIVSGRGQDQPAQHAGGPKRSHQTPTPAL
jgi:hypothetical protein